MAKKSNTQFDTQQVQWDDEQRQRIEQRRRKSVGRKRRRKALSLIVFIAVFAMLASMFGKDIIRLKAENRALKKQQLALEMQRDELQEELKVTNSQDYIREQAKKQLNLLNPGEILFTFDEEEPEENAENAEESKDTEKSEDAGDEKDGGSDG